jgi:hypothetical protein
MYINLHVKYHYSCHILIKFEFFYTYSKKILKYHISWKICPLVAELFHADRCRYRYDEADKFSQFCERAYKWATVTYVGKGTSYITKLFKHTYLKIAYKTNVITGKNLAPKNSKNNDKYKQSGIYQLTCSDHMTIYCIWHGLECPSKEKLISPASPSDIVTQTQDLPNICMK